MLKCPIYIKTGVMIVWESNPCSISRPGGFRYLYHSENHGKYILMVVESRDNPTVNVGVIVGRESDLPDRA